MALIILTDTVTALAAARCRVQYDQPRANLICPHRQPASENKPAPERCPLVRDILRPDPIRPAQSFSLAPPADLASEIVPPKLSLAFPGRGVTVPPPPVCSSPDRHLPDLRGPPVAG